MATDPWARFADAPQDDPWAQFQDAPETAGQPDQFAGDPLLSDDAIARLESGERSTVTQGPSSMGVTRWLRGVNDAAGQSNRAKPAGFGGALDAAASMLRGAAAVPIGGLSGAASALFGKSPEEQEQIAQGVASRVAGRPFSESGAAQLAVPGALAAPIADSRLDLALGPLAAINARVIAQTPVNIARHAYPARRSGDTVPDQPVGVDTPVVGGEKVPLAEGQARPAGLDSIRQGSAEAAARGFAEELGLNWRELSADVQATLTQVATDFKSMAGLDRTALARQAQLESFPRPIPATAGILSRDPVQLRNEGNVAATKAGAPIRETHLDANAAILENIDILKGRTRGRADTPEQVGLSVQDQALRAKLALKKREVREKYAEAEAAGEMQGRVSIKPIIDVIENSPDRVHYGWVRDRLRQMRSGKQKESIAPSDPAAQLQNAQNIEQLNSIAQRLKLFDDDPSPELAMLEGLFMKRNKELKSGVAPKAEPPKAEGSGFSLRELEDLRHAAGVKMRNGGEEAYYAGKLVAAIDRATEGAGGSAYKAARKARREQALEFEEQGAVARLVDNKSRTDRAVALEDTWRKTVIGGSLDDIRKVKRSLLTGGDRKTRSAGRQAWRDIRAQTMQFIKDEATKSVASNERGQPNVTPASMKRAIDKIGPDKMDEIFGPGTARKIGRLLEATRIVKTDPPAIHKGSSTVGNVLALLERGMGKVPLVGDTVSGVVQAGVQLKQAGAASRIAKQSQRTPLSEARNKIAKEKRRNAMLEF